MRTLAILALLTAPAIGQEVLPWSDPRVQATWSDMTRLHEYAGDRIDFMLLQSDFVEVHIAHGFATCGRNHCPVRVVEYGQLVAEFLICANSQTYQLQDRFLTACGVEYYLAPGD